MDLGPREVNSWAREVDKNRSGAKIFIKGVALGKKSRLFRNYSIEAELIDYKL